MSFENVLEDAGVDKAKIVDISALKFGVLAFDPKADEKQNNTSDAGNMSKRALDTKRANEPRRTSERISLSKQFIDALKECKNVFDLQAKGDKDREFDFVYGSIVSSKALVRLRVDLPKRHQKFAKLGVSLAGPVESFWVTIAGSLYCAHCPATEPSKTLYIAHEFRELAVSASQGQNYQIRTIGPSPIHPNFWLVRSKSEGAPTGGRRIVADDDDIYIFVDDGIAVDEVVAWALADGALPLSLFYGLQDLGTRITRESSATHEEFLVLVTALQQHSEAGWWRPIKAHRLESRSRRALSRVYRSLFEIQRMELAHAEERKSMVDSVDSSILFSRVSAYLEEHSKMARMLPDVLLPALAHYGEQLRSLSSAHVGLLASLIGAAIGAILTTVFAK